MIISVEEGTKIGLSFLSSLCASASKNNHEELMLGFFAETVAWKWSGGTEGETTPNALLDVLKNGWGQTCSYWTHNNPFVCIDTENGIIVLTFTIIANVNARLAGVTNINMNPATYILTVNKDKKIVRWDVICDVNNKDLIKTLTNLGVDFPKVEGDPMFITREEGEAFAAKYLKALSDGFLNNSHAEKCHKVVADNVSWEWSDGTKGAGTYEDYHDAVSKSWGAMMASWIPVDPTVVVDTTTGIIAISFNDVFNITGGLSDEHNSMQLPMVNLIHLNKDCKAFEVSCWWDNNDATLQAVVCKIKAKLSTAANEKLNAIHSQGQEVTTGQ